MNRSRKSEVGSGKARGSGVRGRWWMVWAGVALLTGVAAGMPATLPAGHPTVGTEAGQTPKALPAGHPAIGGTGAADGAAAATLPAGHPAIGGTGAAAGGGMPGTLPAGHPSIEQMMAAQAAGTQGAGAEGTPHGAAGAMGAMQGAMGSVEVRVVQGTAGGPVIARSKVRLVWMHPTMTFPVREAEMDENGVARFEKIPVTMVAGLEGMLTFAHAGVEQTVDDIHVTAENPNPKVDFKVYEATAEKPKWAIALRHVDVLEWSKEGAHVQDKYTVRCPGDRIWLGAGEGDKRATMAFTVPANAEQLSSNLPAALTRVETGSLVTGTPVFPGERIYLLDYGVPVKEGKLQVVLASTMDIEKVLVHVPADSATVTAAGLSFRKPGPDEGASEIREYVAAGLPAGKSVELSVGGIGVVAAPTWSAKNVAIGGGVALTLCGVGVLFLKKPKGAAASAGGGAKSRGDAGKMKG